MNFQFNKIAGAVLGTALGVMAVGIVADTIFEPTHSEQPGYVIAVAEPGEGGEGSEGPAARRGAADRRSPADRQCRRRRQGRRQVQGLPHLREGRPQQGRPQPVGRGRRPSVIHGDFNLLRRHAGHGPGGHDLDLREPRPLHHRSEGHCPRHRDELRRRQGPAASAPTSSPISARLSDTPVPLPPPTPAPTAEAQAAPADSGEQPAATGEAPAATESAPAATDSARRDDHGPKHRRRRTTAPTPGRDSDHGGAGRPDGDGSGPRPRRRPCEASGSSVGRAGGRAVRFGWRRPGRRRRRCPDRAAGRGRSPEGAPASETPTDALPRKPLHSKGFPAPDRVCDAPPSRGAFYFCRMKFC